MSPCLDYSSWRKKKAFPESNSINLGQHSGAGIYTIYDLWYFLFVTNKQTNEKLWFSQTLTRHIHAYE